MKGGQNRRDVYKHTALRTGTLKRPIATTLENVKGILAAAGATMDDVVATMVHMVNLDEFARMNAVYGTYFKANPPGRTTVGVTSLPAGAAVEITATAYVGG